MSIEKTDVAIIGGGYYGAFVANEIKTQAPNLDVLVLEKESSPFTRASSTNQGQFHMGYMYSADPALAAECVENIEKFSDTFGPAIDQEVTSLYAVHQDSEISADDYMAFCEAMSLPLDVIDRPLDIFGDSIKTAFMSAEKTFNSAKIQGILARKMAVNGVRVATNFDARSVAEGSDSIRIESNDDDRIIAADRVFNVTFAGINDIHERSGLPKLSLRHDTFLHFVLDLPAAYRNTAATVIRGPFASLLPSSFRAGHILASGGHRRVQSTIIDKPSETITPEEVHKTYDRAFDEAVEYLPVLGLAKFCGHTIGTRAAHFDPETGAYTSRATVFRDFGGTPNYHVVLGGKVSCMFDVSQDVAAIVS